ncbi:Sensor histidine kinase TmoS [Novipirellula aureliae]|uniref:histidine kinase n=2 Tax=Novipirellula aureliae TaxID=2527966 RepID=A0A5C6DGX5_9BACT|nr:Sensor histidine kinase TmoS [Novipirellula aureliae]
MWAQDLSDSGLKKLFNCHILPSLVLQVHSIDRLANYAGAIIQGVADETNSTIDQVVLGDFVLHAFNCPFNEKPMSPQSAPSPHDPVQADAQAEIQYLRAELRKMQSLATLGELMGTATHEFNNVLMTILNYAKLGIRNRDDASRDKALDKILSATERAAKITGTILAQARNRSESLEPTDLRSIITDSLVLLERELRKYRITVETDFANQTPAAIASGNQIQRVVLNLLINSRQAMPEGGTILIKLSESKDKEWVELSVRDSGAGIPKDKLPHIFDAFYTTKSGPDDSGKGGTGLGLAACKEIIDAHHGRIRVESTVGRGTAFVIRLPIAKEQQAAA